MNKKMVAMYTICKYFVFYRYINIISEKFKEGLKKIKKIEKSLGSV